MRLYAKCLITAYKQTTCYCTSYTIDISIEHSVSPPGSTTYKETNIYIELLAFFCTNMPQNVRIPRHKVTKLMDRLKQSFA